jgi:hypothetical protein
MPMRKPAGCGPLVRANRLRTVPPGSSQIRVEQPARFALCTREQVVVAVERERHTGVSQSALTAFAFTPAAIM